MSPLRAAAILSHYAHRGESTWWASTVIEFRHGKQVASTSGVRSRAIELLPVEAIAIASAYLEKSNGFTAAEVSH